LEFNYLSVLIQQFGCNIFAIEKLESKYMFKCYLTGIELNEESAYVLDIAKAKRIIRDLKNKMDALEKMLIDLGHIEKVEIINAKGKRIKQRKMRLICKKIAEAYEETYSEKNIFISWKEWLRRTNNNRNLFQKRRITNQHGSVPISVKAKRDEYVEVDIQSSINDKQVLHINDSAVN